MSDLRVGAVTLPSATLGPANPLPPLGGAGLAYPVVADAALDDELRTNLAHGRLTSVLPYLLQDRYDRTLVPQQHPVAVLENDHLRAEFLLGLGGRLRSLVDRRSGRELLYANPSLQLANLALREAWFAGGVEWNIGMRGHTPLTCAPLHAARVDGPGGIPVLRMWELERIRQVVYQVDCWLPEDVPVLVVAVRVVNPNDHTVPMYWWSNIAVRQDDRVRVLAPGRTAWRSGESGRVAMVDIPVTEGRDVSYPATARSAADYFVRLDEGRRHWVTALDEDGYGLVQSSTRELRGRKLFVWGHGAGGRHWQEWLSPLGGSYCEIQAGLLRTQLEHVAMPAGAQWSWVETYGALQADARVVHGPDWASACDEVERELGRTVPEAWLIERRDEAAALAHRAPTVLLHSGSGWGALELRCRGGSGLDRTATPFPPESLGPEQAPWLGLLEHGRLPPADPGAAPPSYQVSSEWTALLEESPADDWLTWLHRGVARHYQGEVEGAVAAWRSSVAAAPNAWALRNLAVVSSHPDAAAELLWQATELAPHVAALRVELVEALLDSGRAAEALSAVDASPPSVLADPLVQFLAARAAVATGDLVRAERVLESVPMPWVREGSRSLDDLWVRLEAGRVAEARGIEVDEPLLDEVRRTRQVPYELDFRMSQG